MYSSLLPVCQQAPTGIPLCPPSNSPKGSSSSSSSNCDTSCCNDQSNERHAHGACQSTHPTSPHSQQYSVQSVYSTALFNSLNTHTGRCWLDSSTVCAVQRCSTSWRSKHTLDSTWPTALPTLQADVQPSAYTPTPDSTGPTELHCPSFQGGTDVPPQTAAGSASYCWNRPTPDPHPSPGEQTLRQRSKPSPGVRKTKRCAVLFSRHSTHHIGTTHSTHAVHSVSSQGAAAAIQMRQQSSTPPYPTPSHLN